MNGEFSLVGIRVRRRGVGGGDVMNVTKSEFRHHPSRSNEQRADYHTMIGSGREMNRTQGGKTRVSDPVNSERFGGDVNSQNKAGSAVVLVARCCSCWRETLIVEQHNLQNIYTEDIVKTSHMCACVCAPACLFVCVRVRACVVCLFASGSIYQGPAPSRLFRVEVDEANTQRSSATAKTRVYGENLVIYCC